MSQNQNVSKMKIKGSNTFPNGIKLDWFILPEMKHREENVSLIFNRLWFWKIGLSTQPIPLVLIWCWPDGTTSCFQIRRFLFFLLVSMLLCSADAGVNCLCFSYKHQTPRAVLTFSPKPVSQNVSLHWVPAPLALSGHCHSVCIVAISPRYSRIWSSTRLR